MATDAGSLQACAVCGEPLSAAASAECNWCGNRFHLNQRNDVEAKDCGRVWIDEQFLALQFACDSCLASEGMPPSAESIEAGGRTGVESPRITRKRRYRKRE